MIKILLVNHDQSNMILYRNLLKDEDYLIYEAYDGENAIEIALNDYPHLIIVDYLVPKIDALTIAAYIRNRTNGHYLYMILILEQDKSEILIESYQYIDDYVITPIDSRLFNAKVEKGIKLVKLLRDTHLKYEPLKKILKQKDQLLQELKNEIKHLEKQMTERTNELEKKNQLLLKRNEEITHDMELAGRLQHTFIPQSPPKLEKYKIFCLYEPMELIGGDFFDFIGMRENKIAIILGDVSGHGITAAFITSMIKNIINKSRVFLPEPKEFLENLNSQIVDKISHNFATVFFCILDFANPSITYSSAGHLPCLLYRKSQNDLLELTTQGSIVGILENLKVGENKILLQTGDRILIFTDGLIEVFDEQNVMLDIEELKNMFFESKKLETSEVLDYLTKEVKEYSANNAFKDDLAIILIEVL